MLIGQTPGLTEYKTGKPFQGDAGKGIKSVLAELGLHHAVFDELVYSAAVIKCFPGSKPQLRGDKVREDILPSAEMIRNCQPLFEKQIQLADPKIIVTLGTLPLKAYLKLTDRASSLTRLQHFIGRKETWKDRAVIFFPHTSGQSRWLNELKNRVLFGQAKALLRSELLEQRIVMV
jgi:uracil-DNA glycosylase family 4